MALGFIGDAVGAVGGVAGDLLGGILGESPAARQERLQQNEFRGVGSALDFQAPGLQGMRDQRGNLANQFLGSPSSSFRGDQQQLVGMLQSQAQGRGPGQEIARRQAANQAQAGIQNQLSQAAGQRGGASPMAARLAAQQSAGISGAAANAATMGGLQAQQGAIGQLGGALQGARGQDLQADQQRRQAALQSLAQQLQAAGMQQQGKIAREQQRGNRFAAISGAPGATTRGDQTLGLVGGILEGVGLS